MGDEDQFALPLPQELAEPSDRDDVEIVGGLVQKQKVRLRDEHFRKVEPDLVSARKLEGCSCGNPPRRSPDREDALDLVGLVRSVLVRLRDREASPRTLGSAKEGFGRDNLLCSFSGC